MGKVWKIDTHTFPLVWELFSHQIPILWYTSLYGKCMGFPVNFSQYGKMQQNPSYRVNLGNQYSYFSHCMGIFPHTIPILWYTSLNGKYMDLPINFPQHRKMSQNPLYGENLGNCCSYFPHSMGAFFPLDSHFMVYFITWEMHFMVYVITWEKTAKLIEWESLENWFPVIYQKTYCLWRTWEIGTHTFPTVWVLFSIRFPTYGIPQRTQTSLRRLQDVLKSSRRLTSKPDVVRTSGKRHLIYDVFKTSYLRGLKDLQLTTS